MREAFAMVEQQQARRSVFALERFPVHLGVGATLTELDEFTGDMVWYENYGRATASDGVEGRLVTMHTFNESWTTWEMHPHGEELVLCTSGQVTLIQQARSEEMKFEPSGEVAAVELTAGDAVVNPRGVWHTADVAEECTCVFITAGTGTLNRER